MSSSSSSSSSITTSNEIIKNLQEQLQLDPCTLDFANECDKQSFALSKYRNEFHFPKPLKESIPNAPMIYFCGNSLGLQPKKTRQYVLEELDIWANKGVEGHFESHNPKRPWVITDEFVQKTSASLVGANKLSEVAIMNSLSVNLHLLLVAFYHPTPQRYTVIMEAGAFPSDRYAIQSHLKLRNIELSHIIEVSPRSGEHTLRSQDILDTITKHKDTLALVFFSGVQYYTGQAFEIEIITKAAHDAGAFAVWDLAHAVGNIPLKLSDWQVDGACWCTYKYLNSGPGNIGGFFIHQKHEENTQFDRLAGWWGHTLESRFDMRAPFDPIPGAFGYRLSNPPVLCTATLLASLELFEDATHAALVYKSQRLTAYLEYLLHGQSAFANHIKKHITIISPKMLSHRGAQLSLLFHDSKQLDQVAKALEKNNVICDIRKPDVMRIAPAPLYNSFQDVYRFVNIISNVFKSQ